jgi:drug/metabolite transporter (DMT)-like permease
VLLGSCLGFTLYCGMIQRHGATIAAYTGVFIPVVALAWSTFFEHYHWTAANIAGAGVVLCGTLIAARQ